MKITVNQLKQIIREEVQKNLTEANFKVGDKVTEKGTDSGWWEILELIPDKNRCQIKDVFSGRRNNNRLPKHGSTKQG